MPRPLYLTFDDGPDPNWTPLVLDLLARYGARATFFVLGWRVRQHPDLIKAMLRAGHRVELHGHAHLDHEIATSDQLADDTLRALDVLGRSGVLPEWWRVPFSRTGGTTLALADAHRLRIAAWDADTHDWRGDSWDLQPSQVRRAAIDGGVLQLHDAIQLGMPRCNAQNTLDITEHLLEIAAEHGTRVIAMPPAATDEPIRDVPLASPFARSQTSVREWREQDAAAARRRSRSSDQPG